jgi:hypothetical protein
MIRAAFATLCVALVGSLVFSLLGIVLSVADLMN